MQVTGDTGAWLREVRGDKGYGRFILTIPGRSYMQSDRPNVVNGSGFYNWVKNEFNKILLFTDFFIFWQLP